VEIVLLARDVDARGPHLIRVEAVHVWNVMVQQLDVQMVRNVQVACVVVLQQFLISQEPPVYSVRPIAIARLVNSAGIINVLHRQQFILVPIQQLVILVKEVRHVLKTVLLRLL
jgi:flagellar assembly factor FliW